MGTSVFILPHLTVSHAGNGAIWAWILLILAEIPITIVFANLASLYPNAAGPAYFVEKAFGFIAGKSVGLAFLFIVPIGTPIAIIITSQFIHALFEIPESMTLLLQLSLLGLIYLLNFRGMNISATLQLILTLTIAIVLLLMMLAWCFSDIPITYNNSQMEFRLIFEASCLAFWSFIGMEAISHLASDFKTPKKDIKPAMLVGTLIVGCVYLACTWLIITVPTSEPLLMAGVFNELLGNTMGDIVIGSLGFAGGVAAINVYTASIIRLIHSFSLEGVLPAWFRQQNKYNISVRALTTVLIIMAFALIVSHQFTLNLEDLVCCVNGAFLAIYFAAMLAAFKLLPIRYHWVTALGCLVCLVVMWGLSWKMSYTLIIFLIAAGGLSLKQRRVDKNPLLSPIKLKDKQR